MTTSIKQHFLMLLAGNADGGFAADNLRARDLTIRFALTRLSYRREMVVVMRVLRR